MNFITYLKSKKHVITQEWSTEMAFAYNLTADHSELYHSGSVIFDLIVGVEFPVTSHPLFLNPVKASMRDLVDQNMPFESVFSSIQKWREILRHYMFDYHDQQSKNMKLEIFRRIDLFEKEVCCMFIDLKDQKIDQLHIDRIHLIGKLAASMAHEIRNPLTAIEGFLKLIRSTLSNEELMKTKKYFDIVQTEFEGLKMQITGFLSFSKKRVAEEKFILVSIDEILSSTLTLLNPRLIDENINFEITNGIHKPLFVQKTAIQQVLSNILNNSIEALSEVNGPKIIHLSALEDEQCFYINVSNNGPQIPDELKDHLFTPFVTGKESSTGLGLAICKQIMLKNHGDISFVSSEEETTFILKVNKQKNTV